MKVLIIACTDIATDPRVQRQIKALEGNEIITCGSVNADYDFYRTPPPNLYRKLKRFFWLLTGQFERFYWDDYKLELCRELWQNNFDCIVANDIYTLPLAIESCYTTKVYFDAHEYYPQEWQSLKWKFLYKKYATYLCKKYIPLADSFSTVSQGIAEEYVKLTGKKAVIVSNAAECHDLKPTKVNSPIKLVHHGASVPERKIENMIRMMDYLDNHILYLMLTDFDKKYLNYLKEIAGEKVRFIPAVPPSEVYKTLNQFDVGVYILPPSNFNNIHALPNKIFDFVQARLAIAVSPNIEMARLVRTSGAGVVAEDFTPRSMAKKIQSMDVSFHKACSHFVAEKLSAESNYEIIRKLTQS